MHSSLVTTGKGLPLGLAAIKFWNRDTFQGANALKRRINPTRVPIEKKEGIRWLENLRQSTELLGDPVRGVHIGDRESDIYELFCLARELGTHFSCAHVRGSVGRRWEYHGTCAVDPVIAFPLLSCNCTTTGLSTVPAVTVAGGCVVKRHYGTKAR